MMSICADPTAAGKAGAPAGGKPAEKAPETTPDKGEKPADDDPFGN